MRTILFLIVLVPAILFDDVITAFIQNVFNTNSFFTGVIYVLTVALVLSVALLMHRKRTTED
ncbi:hypothetical protein [Halobacillus salinus]|uniref:Uncharacterized protein n=1 Tax=Halobacillus salinus TaxID=192814 RepID=A0A4Z0H0M0_9BACI|nr:hypothetical protein [Halobacillus salinus]TGB03660.1 hypothetical protein E4663_01255 [Halobacillus salinus]